jgi:hypothetical protein
MGYINRTATIPSGQSGVDIDLFGDILVGYFCPAALTGTLEISAVNPNSGTAVSINGLTSTFAAGEYVPVTEGTLTGLKTINIGTGSAEAADRVFILALKEQ